MFGRKVRSCDMGGCRHIQIRSEQYVCRLRTRTDHHRSTEKRPARFGTTRYDDHRILDSSGVLH